MMEIKREHHINFWYVILAFLGIMFIQDLLIRTTSVKTIPYSEYQTLLQQQKLTDIVVGQTTITGKYKDPADSKVPQFSTTRVDAALLPALTQAGVTFSGEAGPGLLATVLGWFMPAIGFFLLWMFLIRPMLSGQGAGGLMAIGKSRAKVYVEKDVKATFADVAGVDEAKDELKEIVAFLRDPARYSQLGAHMPWEYCWSGRREQARRCWPKRSRAKPVSRSFPSPVPNSSKCSWGSAPLACATCSNRRDKKRPRSSSLMNWMRSDEPEVRRFRVSADMTKKNKRSINC